MSDVATVQLSLTEARDLTDEVKADAAALWSKLLRLYEGGAHVALGYSSWADYYEEEFGQSGARGYQLLEAARVVAVQPGLNERQARELAPVLKDDGPAAVEEVWGEVVREHGPAVTAEQVREVVNGHKPERTRGQLSNQAGGTDEWATPQDFYDKLHVEFSFELDVCALPSSAKCARYFTPEDDGLAQDWIGVCWMNPPYGNEIAAWVKKAYESGMDGATVVCLVPARVDTGWWWDFCRYGEIRFLRGRLRFGDAETGAPFPSAVVVFGGEPGVVWWER